MSESTYMTLPRLPVPKLHSYTGPDPALKPVWDLPCLTAFGKQQDVFWPDWDDLIDLFEVIEMTRRRGKLKLQQITLAETHQKIYRFYCHWRVNYPSSYLHPGLWVEKQLSPILSGLSWNLERCNQRNIRIFARSTLIVAVPTTPFTPPPQGQAVSPVGFSNL